MPSQCTKAPTSAISTPVTDISSIGMAVLVAIATTGCERKEFADCAACLNGICGPYAGFDSERLSCGRAQEALCDKIDGPDKYGSCRQRNSNEKECHCKDSKFKWSLRLPIAPT